MFSNNKDFEDYLRKTESNVALILQYLSKNAPTFATQPWETNTLRMAIDKIIATIEQQNQSTAASQETLNKLITISFKEIENSRNKMEALTRSQEELTKNITYLAKSVVDLNSAFEKQMLWNAQTKALIEYLIPELLKNDKKPKNTKLAESLDG